MVDHLKMDPERIRRLRDPARLETVDPNLIWQVVGNFSGGVIADIGTGAGYVALPFAARFSGATIYACDILPGMLELVRETAKEQSLNNVSCVLMSGADTGLPTATVDLVSMLQVHHELDDPAAVLLECHRILKPGGTLVIVDWKHEDDGGTLSKGRRVCSSEIQSQIEAAGFTDICPHPIYALHNLITARR